jgi:hypothetical protein
MKKQPYHNFDQPVKYFADDSMRYVNPRQRDPAEAARLHALPPGTLRAEKQLAGLQIATALIPLLSGDALSEATALLARTLNPTAFYSMGGNLTVMRKTLKLPIMAQDDASYIDAETALNVAQVSLRDCTEMAADFTAATIARSPRRHKIGQQLGYCMGNTGLRLACLDMAGQVNHMIPFDAQEIARNECLQSMEMSRRLGHEIGVYPTIAQLAHPTSPLAVYIGNQVSDEVFMAYQAAVAQQQAS